MSTPRLRRATRLVRPPPARRAPDPTAAFTRLLEAARWPLDECLAWESGPGFACVWVRRHPELPRYAVAVVTGDRDGGLARASARVGAGRAEAWSWVEEARRDGPLVRVDPLVAARLLRGGLQRSRAAGCEPSLGPVCELLALSGAAGTIAVSRAAEA